MRLREHCVRPGEKGVPGVPKGLGSGVHAGHVRGRPRGHPDPDDGQGCGGLDGRVERGGLSATMMSSGRRTSAVASGESRS
jgi:hypothetical protein